MKKIEVHLKYRNEKTIYIKNYEYFASVIPFSATEDDVYAAIEPVFAQFCYHYDSCILLYGQSGSGKTYTAKQVQNLIFRHLYPVESAHLEIYNNTLTDLTNRSAALKIRERKHQIFIYNLTFHTENQLQVAQAATDGRLSSQTALNDNSSRSHYLQFYRQKDSLATLILVDLAGSEKPAQSKSEGERLKEGGEINYSLLVLGRVVNALTQNKLPPFRDSKLTLILKNAFGGAAVTQVIVCLSGDFEAESYNSVQFARRCAGIENRIAKVEAEEAADAKALAAQLSRLKAENQELGRQAGEYLHRIYELQESYDKLKREAQMYLIGVMSKAREREAKLKQQFKMIYWDRQRRVEEAEKAHQAVMGEKMREMEADKDYTDLLAFLNLKEDDM